MAGSWWFVGSCCFLCEVFGGEFVADRAVDVYARRYGGFCFSLGIACTTLAGIGERWRGDGLFENRGERSSIGKQTTLVNETETRARGDSVAENVLEGKDGGCVRRSNVEVEIWEGG